MTESSFLTVIEIAEKLKLPVSWIYSRTRETGPGSIPRIRCGKYLRFDFHEVMDWLREQNEEDYS